MFCLGWGTGGIKDPAPGKLAQELGAEVVSDLDKGCTSSAAAFHGCHDSL